MRGHAARRLALRQRLCNVHYNGKDFQESSERSGKRTKYVCGRCRLAAWAKPDAMLKCGACDLPMYR